MKSSRFCISLCFFLFACTCIAPAFSSSALSESSPTVSATELYSTLSFSTSYYTGGERLIGKLPHDIRYYKFGRKYARLQIQKHSKTNATGVYDVSGYLFLQFPYWRGATAQGKVRFWLNGVWSERARQLLMVGTASWVIKGQPIILDAFLDLIYTARNNPTLYNGYVSGTLSSMVSANDPGFFDPFSIFSFPTFREYNYSLLSQVRPESSTASDVGGIQWQSYEGDKYCWVVLEESIVLELEYAEECSEHHQQHCSPLGNGDGSTGSLPRILLFTPIQCSADERKMRYMARFQDSRHDQGFGLNSTVIGEASWDDEKKELFGIACRLFDPLNRTANEVGDCTMRLSLRYTSIFTVRNAPKLVGRFRSTKHVDKSSYFREINLTKSNGYGLITLPDVRYEYTKLDKVRSSCTTKRPTKRGNTYPDVNSDKMRLALTAENSRGQQILYVDALPLWVEYDLYEKKNAIFFMPESGGEAAEISKPTNTSRSNISYMLSLSSSSTLEIGSLFQSLNWSTNANHVVEITAEGVYDAETGYLCMVGCRKLDPYGKSSMFISTDCEILVSLQFAPLTGERGGLIKGSITSMRAKTDPLYFDELIINSIFYHLEQAALALWRMDLEVVMALMSNTLVCIFAALQIFHVRRNPKVPSFISLFMLLILSVEPMILLVLNFEDAHLKRYPVHEVIGNGGRFESNEVVVRLSSFVALLFHLRLLQLVWNAKRRDESWSSSWFGERKSGFVSLLLYVGGGFLGLLLHYTSKARVLQVKYNHVAREAFSVLGGLRSYNGLIVDGFLLPQILLNAFRGSAEKALSNSFYVGISTVRVAPHAYSLYRLHNYPAFDLTKTYYYANLDVGFYSRFWDIVVPFGIILLVLIIFLQQRRRGCCLGVLD